MADKEYMKRWRERNKEKIKEQSKKDYQLKKDMIKQRRLNKIWAKKIHHSYLYCNFHIRKLALLPPKTAHVPKDPDYHKKYYAKHRQDLKGKSLNSYYEHKAQVIRHYGQICNCCGETELAFLQIDHIRNDGSEHRKEFKGNIYYWLVKNNFPEGFQILCANCNFAKGKIGKCPHTL